MAENICINPACVIAQSKAVFRMEQVQCPVCGQALESIITSFLPLAAENLVHFSSSEEITILAREIIDHYPPIIGQKVSLLFDPTLNYQTLCIRLKSLYFHTVRFAGLIGLSHFLHDPNTTMSKPLLRKIAELHFPFDSTWKEILVMIGEDYLDKEFFISGFPETVNYINRPEAGYSQTIKDNLRKFSDHRSSVLQAGINLRNALHHDNSMLDEADFARISPYYADIVFTILKSFQFLNGEKYWYVAHLEGNRFLKMHGKTPNEITIDSAPTIEKERANQLFLYDTERQAMMPLTPFILKLMEFWDGEGEGAFERMERKSIIYETRISKKEQAEGFQILRLLLNGKGGELKSDMRRLSFLSLIASARDASWESLHSGYINQKYFPSCYVRKAENENLLHSFLVGREVALLLTGPSGIGKSALLADWAHRHLQDTSGDLHPLLINGRNIARKNGQPYPIMQLLCDELMLEPCASPRQFFEILHQLWQNSPVSQQSHIIIIIDAINESHSTELIFLEIDEWIKYCWRLADNCSRYPWLKIVFSIRTTGLESILHSSQYGSDSVFACKEAYYKVPVAQGKGKLDAANTGYPMHDARIVTEYSPLVSLNPLTQAEVQTAFRLYANNSQLYPRLSTLVDKIRLPDAHLYALGNPFLLRIFLGLLDKEETDLNSLPTQDDIMAAYYMMITYDIEIKLLLHFLCREMVEVRKAAEASLEEVARFLAHSKGKAQNWRYTDPFERLLSEGLLNRKSLNTPGEIPDESVVFTQQRMSEYAIYHYLKDVHQGVISKEELSLLLASDCDFDEYNNALTLIMQDYWKHKQVQALCTLPVSRNRVRYLHCLINAIYKPLEVLLKENPSINTQQTLAIELDERLVLILEMKDRLPNFPDVKYIFDIRQFPEWWRHDESPIKEKIIVRALEFAQWFEIGDDYQARHLRVYGGILEKKGQLDEALKYFYESLEITRRAAGINLQNIDWQQRLATILDNVGNIFDKKARFEEALQFYNESLEIRKQLAQNNSHDELLHDMFARGLKHIGDVMWKNGHVAQAMEYFNDSLEIQRNFTRNNPQNLNWQNNFSYSLKDVSKILEDKKRYDEAMKYAIESLEIRKRLADNNPLNKNWQIYLVYSLSHVADIHAIEGRMVEALQFYNQGLEISKRLAINNPTNFNDQELLKIKLNEAGRILEKMARQDEALQYYIDCHHAILQQAENLLHETEATYIATDSGQYWFNNYCYDRIIDILKNRGRLDESLQYISMSIQITEQLNVRNPQNERWQFELCGFFKKIAYILNSKGLYKEALQYFFKTLKIEKFIVDNNPQNTEYQDTLAESLNEVGDILKKNGQIEDALQYYLDSLEIRRHLAIKNPGHVFYQINLTRLLDYIGHIFEIKGRMDKALQYFSEGLKFRKSFAEYVPQNKMLKHEHAKALEKVGLVYQTIGHFDEALTYFANSFEIRMHLVENTEDEIFRETWSNSLAVTFNYIGIVFYITGLLNEAIEFFRESINIQRALVENDSQDEEWQDNLALSIENAGRAFQTVGRMDEALKYFIESLEIRRHLVDKNPHNTSFHIHLAMSLDNVGAVFKTKGQLDKALQYFTDSLYIRRQIAGINPQQDLQDHLSLSLDYVGIIFQRTERQDEALQYFSESLAIRRNLAETNPQNIGLQTRLSSSLILIGSFWRTKGNLEKAMSFLSEGLEGFRSLNLASPLHKDVAREYIEALRNINDLMKECGDEMNARTLDLDLSLLENKQKIINALQYDRLQDILSLILAHFGTMLQLKGRLDEACKHYNDSLNILRGHVENNPEKERFLFRLCKLLILYSSACKSKGNFEMAISLLNEALENVVDIITKLGDVAIIQSSLSEFFIDKINQTDENIRRWEHLQDVLCFMFDHVGNILQRKERLDEALMFFQDSLEIRRLLVASNPQSEQLQDYLSTSLENVAKIFKTKDDLNKALLFFQECLYVRRLLEASNSQNSSFKESLAMSLSNIGNILLSQERIDTNIFRNRLDDALKYFDESLNLRRHLAENLPFNTDVQHNLTMSLDDIGNALKIKGKVDEAMQHFNESFNIRKRLAQNNPQEEHLLDKMTVSLNYIGITLQMKGRLDEALQYYSESLEIQKRLAESTPQNVAFEVHLISSLILKGYLWQVKGNLEKAQSFLTEGLERLRSLYLTYPFHADIAAEYGKELEKIIDLMKGQGDETNIQILLTEQSMLENK